jgi:hypothetical protein
MPPASTSFLDCDGFTTYAEIANSPEFSLATTGALTISAWIKPAVHTFPSSESSGYVHWMGKGESNSQEWVFRIYSKRNDERRHNRISFYVFNPAGGEGIGSHFDNEDLTPGNWIHVTGVADAQRTYIYKDGIFQRCDRYTGAGDTKCQNYDPSLWVTPTAGAAPVRIGSRDFHSFFLGGIAEVRFWNRVLTDSEIAGVAGGSSVPQDGLVAEFLLNQDTAKDSAGAHTANVFGGVWKTG